MPSLLQAKGRVTIRHQQKGVGAHAQSPTPNPDDKIEEVARILASQQNGEPGIDGDEKDCYRQKAQNNIMWNRQQPFDQRQPLIEITFHIRVINFQMDSLLLDGRWILVGE